jgi:hypothetical protein
MSLTQLLVPTYRHMLATLVALLDKAHGQLEGHSAPLLSARLAPDMYPLATQIRFAAYQAQEATFRLRGMPIPPWLDEIAAEARGAGDAPGSIESGKARIMQALAFLDGLEPDALDSGAHQKIALELPNGMAFDMTGDAFSRDWALPQFYFHVVTAYAILRNQGIDIGKADYVPHMFAYLRPQSSES